MAKYITRANPVSIVNVKVADAVKDAIEMIDIKVLDLPADGPARINAVKRELKAQRGADVMLMRINSVTPCSGYYRMLQTDFVKYGEFVPDDKSDDTDTE